MPDDVARLVLGTAALGMAYGIGTPGGPAAEPMREAAAAALVERALAAGIACFDTAPSYGAAEDRLGRALGGRGRVWTKVGADGARSPDAARRSLEASLRRLRRDRLALLSWHNWDASLLGSGEFDAAWQALRGEAPADAFGATTYGAADALAAVECGLFDVVQLEWNVLNQAALRAARPRAETKRVALAVRSVFLQGVLSPAAERLPPHLTGLAPSVAAAADLARSAGLDLAGFALRAALDQGSRFVLVGLDTEPGLRTALDAARAPRLGPEVLGRIAALDRSGDPLVDPRTWARP